MLIRLTEPTAPMYITINQKTNQIHLMVPVVGGQEISTDNTCKSTEALRDFFDGGAIRELTAYKDALVFDIELLKLSALPYKDKEARLAQIVIYISAISAMQQRYRDAISVLMKRPSNLYSVQLRPLIQDSQSKVVNPAFNIERGISQEGEPLSPLYNAMHSVFPDVVITVSEPRKILTTAVLDILPASPDFESIQEALQVTCLELFTLNIDFTRCTDGTEVNKAAIDALMGFGADTTPQEYIDVLLSICAPDMWVTLPAPLSPFYSIPASTPVYQRTEHLSILTQFLLANVNIYCRAKGISAQNFGALLDASNDLSNQLVSTVATALRAGGEVEAALGTFFNNNAVTFELSHTLDDADIVAIKQKFERTYRTVTATKENPHMDDFMILDLEATGENAKFVVHQGLICTNFAEIVEPALPNQDYFACIRKDFEIHPMEMPHKSEWVTGSVEIEPEVLLQRITDEQFEKLPDAIKAVCRTYPTFELRQLLSSVAKGEQEDAEALLMVSPSNTQALLRAAGVFSDYSGRTFKCTAYEYAYWSKDTHMCRMLERYMDDETKAQMLARIDKIERIDAATGQQVGLVYSQDGLEHRSAHFDLTPLKTALQRFVDGYDDWVFADNWDEIKDAWMQVGLAQRELPVHVVNEYCHPDRSFSSRPDFNEDILPRNMGFCDYSTGDETLWFPLVISEDSGLGVDFALWRGACLRPARGWAGSLDAARLDLEAVSRLDEVRTTDLNCSQENLLPIHRGPDYRSVLDR